MGHPVRGWVTVCFPPFAMRRMGHPRGGGCTGEMRGFLATLGMTPSEGYRMPHGHPAIPQVLRLRFAPLRMTPLFAGGSADAGHCGAEEGFEVVFCGGVLFDGGVDGFLCD